MQEENLEGDQGTLQEDDITDGGRQRMPRRCGRPWLGQLMMATFLLPKRYVLY